MCVKHEAHITHTHNQVMVDEEDRLKTSFTKKWENFAYQRIPFGLVNVGVMDEAFKGMINK